MQSMLRTRMAWMLVALFLVSAGHGLAHHEGDHHDHGPLDCALCVLAWSFALTAAAYALSAQLQSSPFQARPRDSILQSAFARSRNQRAPPR